MGPDHKDWRTDVARCLGLSQRPLNLVGVGNPLRRDDGVGILVARLLAKELRGNRRDVVVHADPSTPERVLSKIPPDQGIVIFDAVEAGAAPGTVVCAALGDTDYDFFATHNIPLRLLPGVAGRLDDVFVIGVSPDSVEFGEGLTEKVAASASALASEVANLVRGP